MVNFLEDRQDKKDGDGNGEEDGQGNNQQMNGISQNQGTAQVNLTQQQQNANGGENGAQNHKDQYEINNEPEASQDDINYNDIQV